ncbi:MAG: hypothetical protein LJF06_05020 [Gemmatimonadetes bacterium]|nr:hypothetical protein [Gemmatimonadota bacterium]
MRRFLHRGILCAALAVATAFAACADPGASPLAPTANVRRAADAVVDLNPQPEPPSLQLDFALNPDGTDWFGRIYVGGQACGTMQLTPAQVVETDLVPPEAAWWQSGIVTHVRYTLGIQGANPDFEMHADLAGIIVGGRVVLNGMVGSGAYAGQTLHPRGQIVLPSPGGDQLTTMTGTVQLNPQPEPPSSQYPPSPCVGG